MVGLDGILLLNEIIRPKADEITAAQMLIAIIDDRRLLQNMAATAGIIIIPTDIKVPIAWNPATKLRTVVVINSR